MAVETAEEGALSGSGARPLQGRRRPSISFILAWRNLAQDRLRLLATLAGISFSVVLMTLQTSLLLGFAATASSLIDRADAQLWVSGPGVRDVDQGQGAEISARSRFLALSVHGVRSAEELVVHFLPWRRPDGGTEAVIVVGIDLARGALRPWNLVEGSFDSLRKPDGIILDRIYADKLGVDAVGETVEINGHRARIVGFTQGVRTFTQAPYVFTSLENAKRFSDLADNRTTYLLVRTKPGANLDLTRDLLAQRLPHLDVWTSSGFGWQTRWYWLFSTGAGTALVLAALLGLIVGTITVAQTLYAATVERITEYATLRAMGAQSPYIYSIIIKQALLAGNIGYGAGVACSAILVFLGRNGNVALLLPPELAASVGLMTLAMCAAASILAIRQAISASPAMIFK